MSVAKNRDYYAPETGDPGQNHERVNVISGDATPDGIVPHEVERCDLKEPDRPSETEAALTVLLLVGHAVADGLVEAQRGRCGHRAQDGRQRRGLSLRDISLLLWIQFVPDQHRPHVRLQLQQSLQRELAQVFAEVIGHGLQFVFWFLLLTGGAFVFVLVVIVDNFFDSWKSDRQQRVWSGFRIGCRSVLTVLVNGEFLTAVQPLGKLSADAISSK